MSKLPHITQKHRKSLSPMDFSDDESDHDTKDTCYPVFPLSKNNCCFHPEEDGFNFCSESSIHGLKYIGQPNRPASVKLFWMSAVLALVGWSIYLILFGVIKPFYATPIIIAFESSEVTIDQIPFPGFTLCNANKLKDSVQMKEASEKINFYAENHLNQSLKLDIPYSEYYALQYLYLLCEGAKGFLKTFGYSDNFGRIEITDAITSVGVDEHSLQEHKNTSQILAPSFHRCEDMILLCLWKQEHVACDELFYPIRTEFGYCCTFNMMPQFILRNMKQNDTRVMGNERHMPQDIVKKWASWHIDKHLVNKNEHEEDEEDKELHDKYGHDEYPRHQSKAGTNNGLTILVNPQTNLYHCMAQDSEGFRAEVHSNIDSPHVSDFGIAIRPDSETFISVKAELTLADSDLKPWRVEDRKCYFLGDYNLTTSKFYTQRNCMDECAANLTYNACGCTRYFMPRLSSLHTMCGNLQFNCTMEVKKNMTKVGVSKTCPMCLPACVQIEYFADVTKLILRKDADLWKNFTTNLNEKWANESLSIIHVDFISDSVETKSRKSLFGFNDVLANAGGFLGLTLGFSVISIVEPIYFMTLRLCCKFLKTNGMDAKKNGTVSCSRHHAKPENESSAWTSSKSSETFSVQEHWTRTLYTKKVLVYPSDFIQRSDSNLKSRLKRSINAMPEVYNT